MTVSGDVTLVGRSSSHFTRTARIFAHELGVPYAFRTVPDMTTFDAAAYGGNPALKVPVLLDEEGALFGTENICRAFARRSGRRARVVLRGDVGARIVANAEEMVLHAMNAEVGIITTAFAAETLVAPPKVRRSLENALAFLEETVEGVLATLPADRVLSFYEATLFCTIAHLPFRKVMDVSGHRKLQAFARHFGVRACAQATDYRFDAV